MCNTRLASTHLDPATAGPGSAPRVRSLTLTVHSASGPPATDDELGGTFWVRALTLAVQRVCGYVRLLAIAAMLASLATLLSTGPIAAQVTTGQPGQPSQPARPSSGLSPAQFVPPRPNQTPLPT